MGWHPERMDDEIDGSVGPTMALQATIESLRTELTASRQREEELQGQVAGMRAALQSISTHIDCEGPGCIHCEREEHPPTHAAKIALEALAATTPNPIERGNNDG